jgi:phosphatidylglycerophosphatase A
LYNKSGIYRFLVLFFASGAGTGYSPIASGTVATFIVGIPLYLLFSRLTIGWYFGLLIIILLLATFLCEAGDRILGEKDSSKVVIDEISGYLVTMALVPKSAYTIGAGFLLFRFFDIVKLQPGKWVEDNLPGGLGVLFDDVVAGIYANLIMQFALWLISKRIIY